MAVHSALKAMNDPRTPTSGLTTIPTTEETADRERDAPILTNNNGNLRRGKSMCWLENEFGPVLPILINMS